VSRLPTARRSAVLIAFALVAAACGGGNASIVDGAARVVEDPGTGTTTTTSTTTAATATTTTTTQPLVVGRGVAVISPGGADLATSPTDEPFMRIAEGIFLPVTSRSGDWLETVTTCNERHWVRADEVDLTAQGDPAGDAPGAGVRSGAGRGGARPGSRRP
jgi:hypothetical protein